MPEPLTLQRVGSQELLPEHPVHKVGDDDTAAPPRGQGHPLDTGVGADPEHGAVTVRRPAAQAAAPRERGIGSRAEDRMALHMGDTHGPP